MARAILATLLSIAWCALCWLALGIYGTWVPAELARELSFPWRVVLGLGLPFPWQALPWQLLPVVSLAWVVWGATARGASKAWPVESRLLVHVAGVVTLLCLLGVAMTLPLVDVVGVIGR